ncbi:MAG: helix-turn-helix domain-containing protein [Pseudomonadota bacterium]
MPKVALLMMDGCYASSLTGFMDLLHIANAHAARQLGKTVEPFSWSFVSNDGKPVQASGGLALAAECRFDSAPAFDIVYVPGVYYSGAERFGQFLHRHRALSDWLVQQHAKGAIVAANCTGTFFLGEAGLLDRRQATTTWWLERQFRRRYPLAQLEIGQSITEDERVLCAGAITTYQHLALRMVERYFSPALAALCGKALLVDIAQTAQTPFLSLSNDPEHNDKLVAKAQYQLQKDFNKKISLHALSEELAVSARTLARRFDKVLGMGPLIYLQNLRIEAAKRLLETTGTSIASIVYEIGYEDISSFSRLFQERTGLTPKAYRDRFTPQDARR